MASPVPSFTILKLATLLGWVKGENEFREDGDLPKPPQTRYILKEPPKNIAKRSFLELNPSKLTRMAVYV
jgi:hypothetical protein